MSQPNPLKHTKEAAEKIAKEMDPGGQYTPDKSDVTEIDLNTGPSVTEVGARIAPAVMRDAAANDSRPASERLEQHQLNDNF